MNATEQYIDVLTRLQTGDLGLLRAHAAQNPDASVDGFDLFAGLWWPLREKYADVPRRGVAWLVAKLYAHSPIPHASGYTLARQLRECQPIDERARKSYQQRFDQMLMLPISQIEPALLWALRQLAAHRPQLDWVKLTNDLSQWEQERTRLGWAEQFLDVR